MTAPLLRLLLTLLLAVSALPLHAACEAVLPLQQAERWVESAGAQAAEVVAMPDPLPFAWRNSRQPIRYRLDVSACAGTPAPALWVFRVGAAYRIHDDSGRPLQVLSAVDRQTPAGDPAAAYTGRVPTLFALPSSARHVELELIAQPYLPAGLIGAQLGPTHQLLATNLAAVTDVVRGADIASGVLLILGLLGGLLWLQRRRDLAVLWIGVACGLWGLRGLAYFQPQLLLPPGLFELANPLQILLTGAAMTASILALLGELKGRAGRWLAGSTLAAALALLVAEVLGQGYVFARAWCLSTAYVAVCGLMAVVWRRRADLQRWRFALLFGGSAVVLVCAGHDVLVMASGLPPDTGSWVFWGVVVLLMAFAVLSGEYVVATLARAERSNEELERHAALKTQELEQSYALLRESERETARTQERERLLRDMHDGLGAQLMTALRALERGALAPQQLAASLHDSLDELRLLMDSTDMGHYLPAALAAWRNRWDSRLAAAGVSLQWHIDESLDAVQLAGETALQVMRILQEAAANIVKHAQASHMVFDARVVRQPEGRDALRISIADDGRGLSQEAQRPGARGVKNMHYRAALVGAWLAIGPRAPAPGTEVVLLLPLPPAQATSPRRAASIAASAREEMSSLR